MLWSIDQGILMGKNKEQHKMKNRKGNFEGFFGIDIDILHILKRTTTFLRTINFCNHLFQTSEE